MRVAIAVGGTGGHLFPAQALAEELEVRGDALLCLGAGLKQNGHAARLPNKESLASAPLGIKALWRWPQGIFQAASLLRAFKPDVVVGFGSYHSFPALAAATLLNIPLVLHEQNAVGGKVNRLFARRAKNIGLYFAGASAEFGGKGEKVKMPLRREMRRVPREEAAAYYGLDPKKKTLLIFGGSQGALSLNQLAEAVLTHLDPDEFQTLHFTGAGKEGKLSRGVTKPFETKMHYAWSLADVALCRAGALTLAEGLHFEVPMLLVPYPYASDRHQSKNASEAAALGAAAVMEEADFCPRRCAETIKTLSFAKQPPSTSLRPFISLIEEALL